MPRKSSCCGRLKLDERERILRSEEGRGGEDGGRGREKKEKERKHTESERERHTDIGQKRTKKLKYYKNKA